jgi:hypothetical protein
VKENDDDIQIAVGQEGYIHTYIHIYIVWGGKETIVVAKICSDQYRNNCK